MFDDWIAQVCMPQQGASRVSLRPRPLSQYGRWIHYGACCMHPHIVSMLRAPPHCEYVACTPHCEDVACTPKLEPGAVKTLSKKLPHAFPPRISRLFCGVFFVIVRVDWNLLLDYDGGPNHADNLCDSPIICDKVLSYQDHGMSVRASHLRSAPLFQTCGSYVPPPPRESCR